MAPGTLTHDDRVETTVCSRCVMDTSDPDITFDADGVCNHCRRASRVLPAVQWTAEASEQALEAVAERIRRAGAGKPYDSIIGLSGGVDSSYNAYLARRLGLRPLAVHLDNGWDSELAVENIQRVVEACGFDLETYVIDWREFRDLQRAFLLASVIDIELLTDHAIVAALGQVARRHGVRFELSGHNLATEHGLPTAWRWNKGDWKNIEAIHAVFGSRPLKTFPHLSTIEWWRREVLGRGVESVQLLNLVPYRRDAAKDTLIRELGWRDYGGKHHESLFTKFYQGAILPRKFGIDKRRVHLSDMIRNGEMTRRDAIAILAEDLYDPDEFRVESDYVRKKLGFSEPEWTEILDARPRPHDAFAVEGRLETLMRYSIHGYRRVRRRLAGTVRRRP